MTALRDGLYLFDGKSIPCKVKRIAAKNTRIVLSNGSEKLVPSELVTVVDLIEDENTTSRIVPLVPLEALYRRMRKLTGSREERYEGVRSLLAPRHGPRDADLLAELFARSVRHSEAYSNISEAFYPSRAKRSDTSAPFAKRLVSKLGDGVALQIGSHQSKMVDYELFPFRTRRSCCEDGRPTTRIGSGGMDLLLAFNCDGILPAIGEIKAKTEMVGPTFALVQALLYAAQMATRNQFLRLQKHYPTELGGIDSANPRMDILVLLEAGDNLQSDDLNNAVLLGRSIGEQLRNHLRHICFLWCEVANDGITCEEVSMTQSNLTVQ